MTGTSPVTGDDRYGAFRICHSTKIPTGIGHYPELLNGFSSGVVHAIAEQIGCASIYLENDPLQGRQAQRHRQNISLYLGVRLPDKTDIARLSACLTEFILPINPQAVHGSELVTDWCQEQQIDRPAAEHLERLIRSAVHQCVTKQQNILFTRLSLDSKVAINHLLSAEAPGTARINEVTFSGLKADLGRPGLGIAVSAVAREFNTTRQTILRVKAGNSTN